MCMLTSTVSLAFFEGILDYLEQRESGRQEMLAQCSRILCCSSIRTPVTSLLTYLDGCGTFGPEVKIFNNDFSQEINNLRFLTRPLSRWVKVKPFSGMWDRDLMFLQARQILKDFGDRSISSNQRGLFIKLSGPQDARLVFERFHGKKFYDVIAVASYISENEFVATIRYFDTIYTSLPTFKVSFFVLVCFVVVQRWYFVFPYREWHFGHHLFWAAVLKFLVLSIASWMLSNPTIPRADGCMMLAAWLYVLVEASLDVLEENFNANVNQARQICAFFCTLHQCANSD
uniref:Uncharacterized protein n=1 Tax=Ditylenchus dipsaci TaxID=166011 RepID=A0A915D564_9BILA